MSEPTYAIEIDRDTARIMHQLGAAIDKFAAEAARNRVFLHVYLDPTDREIMLLSIRDDGWPLLISFYRDGCEPANAVDSAEYTPALIDRIVEYATWHPTTCARPHTVQVAVNIYRSLTITDNPERN